MRTPPAVILDTDIYDDMDDMLALAMLHTLADRGELKIVGVTIGTEARWTAPYVDLVNTFYGRGDIPIGIVRDGVSDRSFEDKRATGPRSVNYTQHLAQLTHRDGTRVYPHDLLDSAQAEEAVILLRKLLAAQSDQSVVLIQIGYSTNFAQLLNSKPDKASALDGRALIQRKVRWMSAMAGRFAAVQSGGKTSPAGLSEFNLRWDVPAAQKLFAEWPTPIVVSGYEIGFQMRFPGVSIERDFRYVERHPIAETYAYVASDNHSLSEPRKPHDHATYDLTSVLYAARPERGYFSLSPPCRITVLPDGGSRFEPAEGGLHRYLIQDDSQRARTLEAMVMLASQPPVRRH